MKRPLNTMPWWRGVIPVVWCTVMLFWRQARRYPRWLTPMPSWYVLVLYRALGKSKDRTLRKYLKAARREWSRRKTARNHYRRLEGVPRNL